MAQAYHWDALRKKRVLDRKHEALDRLMHAGSENPVPTHIMARACEPASNIVSTDPEQFNQIRSVNSWIGRERNKREYDHSRDGPLLNSSWQGLRTEYGFRKQATPVLDGMGKPVSFSDLILNRNSLR
ncbi:hypothetical protein SNE40_005528 [Patella caerulea]|uniref:Uncharacterized protein n=1 Tax=Patella caerulea TaxID=87958 RepID=A0AAN8K8D6_PATCE